MKINLELQEIAQRDCRVKVRKEGNKIHRSTGGKERDKLITIFKIN